MSRPSRGGADSVRYASSSASRPREASMTVLDVDTDDPNLKTDAWFAWVMPTQTGVQMVGTGRYGYWEERPKATYEPGSGVYRVEGHSDEPILLVPAINAISLYIAQGEHTTAYPMPTPQEPQDG